MVGVDANGSFSGGIWTAGNDTCCAAMSVTQGANYGSSTAFSLPADLTDGTYHLFFTGYPFGVTNFAIDLFFGSPSVGSAAQITAYFDGTNTSSGTGTQPGYGFTGNPPNGSLTFVDGPATVTASNFQIVDQQSSIVGLDLTVTGAGAATPEPASIGLISMGVGLLALRARKRRK